MTSEKAQDFKTYSDKRISKVPNTKIDFAYYFPQDLTNNLEIIKKEELNQNIHRNFQELVKEKIRVQTFQDSKGEINKNENDREFDRSYYTNYIESNPCINSQNENYESYLINQNGLNGQNQNGQNNQYNQNNNSNFIRENPSKGNKKIILNMTKSKNNPYNENPQNSQNIDTKNNAPGRQNSFHNNNIIFPPQNINISCSPSTSTRPKYSPRYFVIKSIDEDNIHKSIKYKIWCSTTKGNLKLNKAYKESHGSPIYLLFSVNGSGRFLGVAQMSSEIDLNANFNYWSQMKKWKGFFCVAWLIIKDVPNRAFNNIINEFNENKPVSSSRDTQEINAIAGAEMLRIFQEYKYESSILEDFEFYELKQQKLENNKDGDIQKEEKLDEKISPGLENGYNNFNKISRKHSDSLDVEKYFSNMNLNSEYGLDDNSQTSHPHSQSSNLFINQNPYFEKELIGNKQSVKRILRRINEI